MSDGAGVLRCLIQDISLDSFSQPGQTRIQIRWQTGAVTPHTVSRPTAADGHRLDATLVALIRELAQTHPDDQVAEILNQRGLKSQQGLPWSYRLVMETRRRHQIPTACPITPRGSEPRGDGLISLKAAAQRFDTHSNTILLWARKGILYSEHKPGMCPIWVRVTPDDFARLTQVTAPSGAIRIRQACKVLQLSEAQLWDQVKAGRYTVCRVQQNQHWEFRITLHQDLMLTS